MVGYRASTPSGTGGAGIAGVISGLQQAQQFGANQQQMDNSEARADMMEKNFNDSQMANFNVDKNKAIGSWDFDDDDSALKELATKYPKLAKGMKFRRLNDDEIYQTTADGVEGDGFQNSFKNKYQDAMHTPFDPTGDVPAQLQKLRMYSDDETPERMAVPEHLEASTNYGAYKRDYINQQRLANAKIAKAGGSGKTGNIDKVAELIKFQDKIFGEDAKPTEEDYRNFNTYSDLNGVTKPNAVRLINQDKGFRGMNDAINKDEAIGSITDGMQSRAELAQEQSGNELPAGEKKTLDDDIITYETLTDLNNQVVSLLKDGGSAQGTLQNAFVEAGKYLNTDEFKKLKPEEQRQFLQTISLRSGLGSAGSQILQAISGAGVSEGEYNRVMENLLGGDINKINFQTIQAALQGSSDIVKKRVGGRIKNLPRRNIGDKTRYARRMDRTNNPKAYEVNEDGNKTLADAPKTLLNNTISDLGSALGITEAEATKWKSAVSGTKGSITKFLKNATPEKLKEIFANGDSWADGLTDEQIDEYLDFEDAQGGK